MAGSETTEWEDIQRKFGNLPPKELVVEEEQMIDLVENSAADFTGDHKYDHMDWNEIELLEDEVTEDEERLLQDIRRKRLQEMMESQRGPSFGFVMDLLRRGEFESEVTKAGSVFVVVHLYQNRHLECEIMDAALKLLANKFKRVKFVRIVSTVCIPNYSDSLVPTLLLYHEGKVVKQFVGLAHFGGKKMTPEDVEWELAQVGALQTTLHENPHTNTKDRVYLNIKRK